MLLLHHQAPLLQGSFLAADATAASAAPLLYVLPMQTHVPPFPHCLGTPPGCQAMMMATVTAPTLLLVLPASYQLACVQALSHCSAAGSPSLLAVVRQLHPYYQLAALTRQQQTDQ